MQAKNTKGRLKVLADKFSYKRLALTCEKEGWEIPLLAELEGLKCPYKQFWVADLPDNPDDHKTHARIFSETAAKNMIASKSFLFHAVVIVIDKYCRWEDIPSRHTHNQYGYNTGCGRTIALLTPASNMSYCGFCGEKMERG